MARGPVSTTNADGTPKVRKARTPSTPKAAYFIVQVLDEDNSTPVAFPKARLRIVSVERSADKVLEVVEGGSHPHAIYLRGMLPVGRGI